MWYNLCENTARVPPFWVSRYQPTWETVSSVLVSVFLFPLHRTVGKREEYLKGVLKMKYTEKVMEIVKTTLAQMEQITGQIEDLNRRYKAEEISGMDYQAQKAELEKQRDMVRLDATQQLQDTGKAYRAAVEQGTEIDSTMLHDDAKLLQLDMKMTAHQFEALVEKHKDNPLMAQLLQEYSDKHEGLYAGFLPTIDGKIGAFEGFVGSAMNTLRMPDSMQSAFFQDGKYIPEICTESE